MKRFQIIKPEYYDQFSCKGSHCRYTCCQGWTITLSKDEYRKIKGKTDRGAETGKQRYFQKLSPENKGRNVESSIILNKDSQCPFLSKTRLCELQCKFGAGILPQTCIRYPRSNHLYLDSCMQAMSPGCEKVLELSFQERKIRFKEEEKRLDRILSNSQITKNMISSYPLLDYYKDLLSLCLRLLQAEDTVLENRLLLLGIALRHIEALGKDGKLTDIPDYISRYTHLLETTENMDELLPHPEINPLVLMHNLHIAQTRESISNKAYENMLHVIYESLHLTIIQTGVEGEITFSGDRYQALKEKYDAFLSGREHFMENLMVTFLLFMNMPFTFDISFSIWDNYMYMVWTYSIVKLCLTACMDEIHTEGDFIHYCSILMRSWAHSNLYAKKVIENFRKNGSNTLAHMATLLYS